MVAKFSSKTRLQYKFFHFLYFWQLRAQLASKFPNSAIRPKQKVAKFPNKVIPRARGFPTLLLLIKVFAYYFLSELFCNFATGSEIEIKLSDF
jgi:hypothetical protein